MLRLLTLTLLASGVLAQNDTTTTTVAADPNATVVTTTTAANGTGQAGNDATTTTTASGNQVVVTTTQPTSTDSGNTTKLAADATEIDAHAVEADTLIKADVTCSTCADGCAANTMVWCKAGYNALKHYVDEAATANSLTEGKCTKEGKLLSGHYCAQSAPCAIGGAMAAQIKCHIHNPNFGDMFSCSDEAGSTSCTNAQTNLDKEQKVTARRLVARRNLSTVKAEYTTKATMRVKKTTAMTEKVVKEAVNAKIDSLTDESMATKVKSEATAYANTLSDAMLPEGTTGFTAQNLKDATANANVTATKPVATVPSGSTAGATSAAISAAAVAAALLF